MDGRNFSFTVTEEYAGRRADEVLRAVFGMSARQIRLIKYQKGFYLDGQCVYANAVVRAGQQLCAVCENAYDQHIAPEAGELDILYEDEHLMILNKPAPMATLPAPGQPFGTLANRVAAHCGTDKFIFRPVNRLDRGTSGLMVAAKHPLAQNRLMEQLHTDDFVREYEALAQGVLPSDVRVDAPIDRLAGDPVRRCVRADGKPSVTCIRVLRTDDVRNLSHLRLRLLTGRTHQIRVHLAHIGHPVLGDYLYGTPLDALEGRFALHAAHLRLKHPFTGEALAFTAPMPEEMRRLLDGF